MAQRLLDGEIPVVAYNRTSSKLEPLRNAGAETTDSAADAIAAADCVILMLADANAIRQVALSDSCQDAPTFDKKLNRMQDSNFADPNFPLKHLLKDINLFLSEAKAEGLEASSLAGVRQVVENAQNAGLADEDYSSLYLGITQTLG